MTSFVLDCSVAAAWCFEDEAGPESDALLDRLRNAQGVVPTLWRLEVANVLLNAERRGRVSAVEVGTKLALLAKLPIRRDEETEDRAFVDTVRLARAHRLTSYDAAYLELAIRCGIPLATRDRLLAAAAMAAGVPLLPAG